MNLLLKAKEQQKKAAFHGRRTKLERSLNAIGLSLFAPPFGSEDEQNGSRLVQFNQWEGVTVSNGQPEIFRLISAVATAINDINTVSHDWQLVQDRCEKATAKLTNLARYCSKLSNER